jgi:hypothetical protein
VDEKSEFIRLRSLPETGRSLRIEKPSLIKTGAKMNPLEDIKSLKSSDFSVQVPALRRLTNFIQVVVDEAVNTLRETEHPMLVAEQIFLLGSLSVSPLERLFLEIPAGDLKIIVSSLLVQLGSKSGVATLLEAIRTQSTYEHLAATSLAKANINEAAPVIIQRLERLEREFYMHVGNAPFIQTYLTALHKLQCPLPSDLRQRFTAPGVPPFLM